MINPAESEDWLAENSKQMIDCPYQPGGLKISRASCRRRFLAGLNLEKLNGDSGLYSLKKGLLVCGECPIGKKLGGGKRKEKEGFSERREDKFLLRSFPYGSIRKIRESRNWKNKGG